MATQNFYSSGLNPDPGFLAICRGLLEGFRPVIRNGLNPDVDTGATESICDQGGLYIFPTSAAQLTVSSTSAADTGAGSGARTVLVIGLDATYADIAEVVTLAGLTPVTTANAFLRVFNLVVASAGLGDANAGDIYVGTGTVTAGVPATIYARARPGWNNSQLVAYTIPAGFTGYLVNTFASAMGSAVNQSTLLSLRRRAFGSNVFVRSGNVVVGGQACDISGHLYTRFAEKTDIDAVCDTTDSNVVVSGQLRILLVPGNDNPA